MTGFTDIHAHFIYGLDDGAKTRADMEAMIDAAHADGIVSLFATPHVTPGLEPFSFKQFEQRLEEARAYCRQRGYGMNLYSGAEVMYTPAMHRDIMERRLPGLGGGDHVLMEFTPDISYREMESVVEQMERVQYVPVLAHIERYSCLFMLKNAWRLRERHEVRYQINVGSVTGRRGFFRDQMIQGWFRSQLIDFVASDAHDAERRPFKMRAAYGALMRQYGREYAARLTGLS